MTAPQRLNIEALHHLLKCARRRGVRASRLLQHTPDLVELLYPAATFPDITALDRALAVEHLIRIAVDVIGGDEGYALAITLCLPPGTMGIKLDDRRKLAAERMQVQADTWRRGWEEGALFYDLAVELHRLHHNNPHPSPPSHP